MVPPLFRNEAKRPRPLKTETQIAVQDVDSIVSQTLRPDTYVVLDLLPQLRIEWLRQQSLHVAEVFRRSISPQGPS